MRRYKLVLSASVFCILLSGLFVAYRSHQLSSKVVSSEQADRQLNTAYWVGQSLALKLQNLEASVSYLDKSSVETLQRLGIRYFAYAFYDQTEWKIKWKVIGDMDKKAILDEVKDLKFDELSKAKRSWFPAGKKEFAYVVPAKISESKQLSSGFLIFGMGTDFFDVFPNVLQGLSVIGTNDLRLYGPSVKNFNLSSLSKKSPSLIQSDDQSSDVASFSSVTQLSVVLSEERESVGFSSSAFFMYFLIGSLFSALLFILAATLLVKPRQAEATQETESSVQETTSFDDEDTIVTAPVPVSDDMAVTEIVENHTLPVKDSSERIEIGDDDTDAELFGEFTLSQPTVPHSEETREPATGSVSGDLDSQFVMKTLDFTNDAFETTADAETTIEESVSMPVKTEPMNLDEAMSSQDEVEEISNETIEIENDKGLFEIGSDQFKLKIRSPKKKDTDVNS